MFDAFSTLSNKNKTIVFLVICVLSAIGSVIVGIDENPPGILLAFLAAIAFILAFAHPWRTVRKFVFLLLASILGIVLFIVLDIILNSTIQNPTTSGAIQNLIESPAYEALNLVFAILIPSAFIVGVVGSIAMFIRNRRQTK
jgi:hypothetical protein